MEVPHSDSLNVESSIYYAVYIPSDDKIQNQNPIFHDKTEALQFVKQHKQARFKAFGYYHEAADFAANGADCPNNNTTQTLEFKLIASSPGENTQILGEKPSPFKGPKSQDLVALRKAIERGEYETVRKTIWKNPRYLISSGDTPSLLQEGVRYNALHVAAKAKNADITRLILNTVTNVEFVKLLYGDDNLQNAERRAAKFLDLYLNTPDKGLNETPLHFAVKFGGVEVVEVLVSYPQCDRNFKNKYGSTPEMIICDRCDKIEADYKKIKHLLQDCYYVPVLRAEDNSLPPTIGAPFSPADPPVYKTDPLSPRLEIHAYAGPMNKEGAEHFRKVWKTPPRSLSFSSPARTKDSSDTVDNLGALRFKDPNKGLEIVGKTLANKYDITWKEYWPFLDSFVDIASKEGLDLLEAHLHSKVPCDFSSKSFLVSSNHSASKSKQSIQTNSLSDLCSALQAFTINSPNGDLSQSFGNYSEDFSPYLYLEKSCQVFVNRISNDVLNSFSNQLLSILETETKQLEVMILSYLEDLRFRCVNFNTIHSRLGWLIGEKLASYLKLRTEIDNKIEFLLNSCSNCLDCFSSDDEESHLVLKNTILNNKPTHSKKQLLCLLFYISKAFSKNMFSSPDEVSTEEDCMKIWQNLPACSCKFYSKKSKKGSNLNRNTNGAKLLSRKLCFDFKENLNTSMNSSFDILNEDTFYTPPASPTFMESENSDLEDSFEEAEAPNDFIFIEGTSPTKTDYAVYNALRYAQYEIKKSEYPHVYLWKHNISLFKECERKTWPSPSKFNPNLLKSPQVSTPNVTSTPKKKASPHLMSPTKSWLRITGTNSPRARSIFTNN